jgi:hypothetical protein
LKNLLSKIISSAAIMFCAGTAHAVVTDLEVNLLPAALRNENT